jgi:hypothetical protein
LKLSSGANKGEKQMKVNINILKALCHIQTKDSKKRNLDRILIEKGEDDYPVFTATDALRLMNIKYKKPTEAEKRWDFEQDSFCISMESIKHIKKTNSICDIKDSRIIFSDNEVYPFIKQDAKDYPQYKKILFDKLPEREGLLEVGINGRLLNGFEKAKKTLFPNYIEGVKLVFLEDDCHSPVKVDFLGVSDEFVFENRLMPVRIR